MLNFRNFLAGFCCEDRGSTYRVTYQTSFFPTWFTSIDNVALAKKSFRLLPFGNPISSTLGNTFLCSLLGVNNIRNSSMIALRS